MHFTCSRFELLAFVLACTVWSCNFVRLIVVYYRFAQIFPFKFCLHRPLDASPVGTRTIVFSQNHLKPFSQALSSRASLKGICQGLHTCDNSGMKVQICPKQLQTCPGNLAAAASGTACHLLNRPDTKLGLQRAQLGFV
jgi:hypothetical protein